MQRRGDSSIRRTNAVITTHMNTVSDTLTFLKRFNIFGGAFSSQQPYQKVTAISCVPPGSSHMHILPLYQHRPPEWYTCYSDEPPLTRHSPSESTGVHSQQCRFCRFGPTCLVSSLQYCADYLTAVKTPCSPSVHPFSHPQPPTTLIFCGLHSFAFFTMSYSWSHTACSVFRLPFFHLVIISV